MHTQAERALACDPDLLCDVVRSVGEWASVDHAVSTNNSIVKLSDCSLCVPWCDGSRRGFEPAARPSCFGTGPLLICLRISRPEEWPCKFNGLAGLATEELPNSKEDFTLALTHSSMRENSMRSCSPMPG